MSEEVIHNLLTPIELFGIECEAGWTSLIIKVQEAIDKYNLEHEPDLDLGVMHIVQAKEKWGALDIFLNYYTPEIEKIINEVHEESKTICEFCGTKENVKLDTINGYLITLCDKCRQNYINRYKY